MAFYLIIHVAVMNFFDLDRIGKMVFNKQDHESIGEYFIQELDAREKVMDSLLGSLETMNQKYEKLMKGQTQSDESYDKQAA